MRELRAVRVSDDGKELLLTETNGTQGAGMPSDPGFLLPADDRLRAMLRPRPTVTESRPESALTPREIQARLRAGDTAEEVAEAAGIPVARVARYEAPIAAERVRIVDEVRRATAPGPHRVSPGRQLGAVVDDRLADDGLDPVLAQWLARRRVDGTWLVTVDLGDHHAEWSWDGSAKRVRAHDNGAQRLLSPSRSSAESLIAVAQATGVTVEPAPVAPAVVPAEPPAPLAPARAVGESTVSAAAPSRPASPRSGLVVLAGEGASSAASAPRAQASSAPTLDDIPGTSAPAAPKPSTPDWTPGENALPGSGSVEARHEVLEPSASAGDESEDTDEPRTERPARPAAKSGRRRSAVPAWDDIVFGARRS
ncbi:MAG TPA: septation protein SepH [Frankiaceae bacterium]|nr:septation protein SepH [Frankiaceae bacterium]